MKNLSGPATDLTERQIVLGHRCLPFFAYFVFFVVQSFAPASVARAEELPLATGLPKFLGCAYSAPQARDFASYWNEVTP